MGFEYLSKLTMLKPPDPGSSDFPKIYKLIKYAKILKNESAPTPMYTA